MRRSCVRTTAMSMLLTVLAAFTVIALVMRHLDTEDISGLAGLSQRSPLLAATMTLAMVSLAGIPPLAGFFAKFYVFLAAIHAGLYGLAVIGVLLSVVGAYYYLRIVKIMYFDAPAERFEPMPATLAAVLGLSGIFVLVYSVYPAPLVEAAGRPACGGADRPLTPRARSPAPEFPCDKLRQFGVPVTPYSAAAQTA